MITFTKEQLIASAHARIEFADMMLAGELEPLKERTWSIELELARIALASLEAEATGVVRALVNIKGGFIRYETYFVSDLPDGDYELYTAPSAQEVPEVYNIGDATMRHIFTPAVITDVSDMQAVFDQIETVLAGMWQPATVVDEDLLHMAASAIEDLLSNKDRSGAGVWADLPAKLRRAAMLQGADGNSPVIQDGWVMVPVDATRAMIDAARRVEEDGYDAMHKAMIAAAPQQEVKNG